jgi:hypothetical protein
MRAASPTACTVLWWSPVGSCRGSARSATRQTRKSPLCVLSVDERGALAVNSRAQWMTGTSFLPWPGCLRPLRCDPSGQVCETHSMTLVPVGALVGRRTQRPRDETSLRPEPASQSIEPGPAT